MKVVVGIGVLIFLVIVGSLYFTSFNSGVEETKPVTAPQAKFRSEPAPAESPAGLPAIPDKKIIPIKKHLVQSFNNCGPATLAMLLSYYGEDVGQEELGQKLRPYQVTNGDNDDKTVFLNELESEARNRGYYAILRPNGDINLLKQLIARDIPVILITWLKENEDIGHYRIIRGYDDTTGLFTQDDSYQGKNLTYKYSELEKLWQPFNYQYLIIAPEIKKPEIAAILKDNLDQVTAWKNAAALAKQDLAVTSKSTRLYPEFNLSVSSYYTGDFQQSINSFESVRSELPSRMLWYQIEPIKAYLRTGNYSKVLELTDQILQNNNRAFSELYHLRAQAYLKQGKPELAEGELQKARMYNKNATFTAAGEQEN